MPSIVRTCILVLVPAFLGCRHTPAKLQPEAPRAAATVTVTQESQATHFSRSKKRRFPDSGIVKAVGYSFLDVEEDDTANRGQLLSIINDPGNYSNTAAFCYNPRNCFCFYNSKNEIVGWYEVCFECARVSSIPAFALCRKGGLNDRGLNRLKTLCTSVKLNAGKL